MKQRHRKLGSEEAITVSISYVLNMGLASLFIVIMLYGISSGFGEAHVEEEQMEFVAAQIHANLIEVDELAQAGGPGAQAQTGKAAFEPPTSGVEYQAEIDGGGDITVWGPEGGSVELEYDLRTPVSNTVSFDQSYDRVILDYDPGGIEMYAEAGYNATWRTP